MHDGAFKNLPKGKECNRTDLIAYAAQIMDMSGYVKATGYVLFWYLLGLNVTWGHTHKTSSWHLLGVSFKESDQPPRLVNMGIPPGSGRLQRFDCISDRSQ